MDESRPSSREGVGDEGCGSKDFNNQKEKWLEERLIKTGAELNTAAHAGPCMTIPHSISSRHQAEGLGDAQLRDFDL
jgi:hypothetical protein